MKEVLEGKIVNSHGLISTKDGNVFLPDFLYEKYPNEEIRITIEKINPNAQVSKEDTSNEENPKTILVIGSIAVGYPKRKENESEEEFSYAEECTTRYLISSSKAQTIVKHFQHLIDGDNEVDVLTLGKDYYPIDTDNILHDLKDATFFAIDVKDYRSTYEKASHVLYVVYDNIERKPVFIVKVGDHHETVLKNFSEIEEHFNDVFNPYSIELSDLHL